MITINFVRKGTVIPVKVEEGASVMEAAKFFAQPSIEEIPAICGGACACATCHIHVDKGWIDKVDKLEYDTPESELLEYELNFKEGVSRLGCQIVLKPEHDGLVVHLLDNELL